MPESWFANGLWVIRGWHCNKIKIILIDILIKSMVKHESQGSWKRFRILNNASSFIILLNCNTIDTQGQGKAVSLLRVIHYNVDSLGISQICDAIVDAQTQTAHDPLSFESILFHIHKNVSAIVGNEQRRLCARIFFYLWAII